MCRFVGASGPGPQLPKQQLKEITLAPQLIDRPLILSNGSAGGEFRTAILTDSDMREAQLTGADLCRAEWRNVRLRGAKLAGTHLRGADLMGSARTDSFCTR